MPDPLADERTVEAMLAHYRDYTGSERMGESYIR